VDTKIIKSLNSKRAKELILFYKEQFITQLCENGNFNLQFVHDFLEKEKRQVRRRIQLFLWTITEELDIFEEYKFNVQIYKEKIKDLIDLNIMFHFEFKVPDKILSSSSNK